MKNNKSLEKKLLNSYQKNVNIVTKQAEDEGYRVRALLTDSGPEIGAIVAEETDGSLLNDYTFEKPQLLLYRDNQEFISLDKKYIIFTLDIFPFGCTPDDNIDNCQKMADNVKDDYKTNGGIWVFNIEKREFKNIFKIVDLGSTIDDMKEVKVGDKSYFMFKLVNNSGTEELYYIDLDKNQVSKISK